MTSNEKIKIPSVIVESGVTLELTRVSTRLELHFEVNYRNSDERMNVDVYYPKSMYYK